MDDRAVERGQRVTPLELFFDLVVVFAITQVTRLLSDEPTWGGLLRGLLLLGALWWAWAAYAWLTNTLDPPVATILLLGLLPLARAVPALAALGLVAAVCAALIAYEALRYPYARAWIRSRRGAFTMEEPQGLQEPAGGPVIVERDSPHDRSTPHRLLYRKRAAGGRLCPWMTRSSWPRRSRP